MAVDCGTVDGSSPACSSSCPQPISERVLEPSLLRLFVRRFGAWIWLLRLIITLSSWSVSPPTPRTPSCAGTLGRAGGYLLLEDPSAPHRNERVPLQLGVLGVGGDTDQLDKVMINRSNQIHAPNRLTNSLRRLGSSTRSEMG